MNKITAIILAIVLVISFSSSASAQAAGDGTLWGNEPVSVVNYAAAEKETVQQWTGAAARATAPPSKGEKAAQEENAEQNYTMWWIFVAAIAAVAVWTVKRNNKD